MAKYFLFGYLPFIFAHVPQMDKSFFADEKCTGCRICAKICPAQNIGLVKEKPQWEHHCEQCFACIQWCPENQFNTADIRRRKIVTTTRK